MKKLTLFLLTLIISCSAWGATKTIYCKNAQGWWKADGAAVGAYAWGNGTNASWPGVRMTKVDGESDLWSIELDTKYTNIIFTRVNGSGSIADWGAKTKDLTIPTDGKNLYTISSSSAVWGDPGVEGTWSTYTPPTVSFENLQDTYYVGDTYTFAETHDGLGTGAVTRTYSVSYNEGTSQLTSGTYTFEKAGSYTFTVKVTTGSKTATASKTVTVLEAKYVSFNNIENIYYIGGTYTFSATAHGLTDPITYTYTVNDNPITKASYTFNELGEYTIKVTATATNGTVTATHKVTIEATVSFTNNKTDYSVGESFDFATTSTGILNPTYSYSVEFEGNTTDITGNDYIFQDKGTYIFTVNALYNGKTIVSNTQEIKINPTVTFTAPTETFVVGDKHIPTATATKILKPTYTYKVNNEEIDPTKGYIFKNTGDFIFSVEVKNNGEGNVLASENYIITITNPTVVYLKPNSNWKIDNARFAIYCFTSGENWYDMTDENGDGIYECIVPKGQTDIIFCRMTPSNTANNWNTKWNQTVDLKVPTDGNNLYEVKSGTWDKGGGSWSTYKPSKLYISGDLENEIEVKDETASTTMTGAFPAGTYDIVVNDGTRYWQNATSITIEETVPTIDFSVDATTKEITVTPKNTFTEPSNLIKDTKYGNLSYQLTMPDNRWYWIVLPFDVNVKDITTSTGKWDDLVYTEYDAEKRAKGENGWINWSKVDRYNKDQVLKANKGYVIGPKDDPFDQDGDFVVTFPSASPTNDVTASAKAYATRTGDGKNDNWNIIGTGLYHNASLKGINYVALPARVNNKDSYKYKYITSSKEPFFTEQIETNSFAPFEAFFVQYGGDYSATAEPTKSAAELAPMARAKAQEQEQIYLINMNEAHTVVILNNEGSEGYTAGEDFLEMNLGSRIEMIYSFDGTDALAFNHRAPEAQSIALGGYVATAGEQTISLNAYNGNAEAVTLIDNLTGETADLLAGNYTFTAEVGSLDGRFTIVFATQKAGGVTTDCYNSVANQVIAYGTADHCTVSGLTTGEAIAIYNTMGQLVFATIANSETITLPSLTAGNYLILHNGTTNKVALR